MGNNKEEFGKCTKDNMFLQLNVATLDFPFGSGLCIAIIRN
jgi:hypothetical protein